MLAVVLFHGFPEAIPGGFIGVDVFFVISGFLITSIILRNLQEGRFSFVDFYARRVRRIFPSLFVVLLTCYVLGWFLLFKNELRQLGLHIASGAGFASNFLLWKQSGYFDKDAATKPLLHLWSLGIEEQFYLLFPLIFYVAHRLRWRQNRVIVGLLLLSFLVNVLSYQAHPTAAFYSPIARFWELLCGSLLAAARLERKGRELIEQRGRATSLSCFGFGLLALGVVLGSPATPFPGWFAVLPVLGATAIIAAGKGAGPNRWLLSSLPMRWIGAISYPLYLWHWPLLVFARVAMSGVPSFGYRAALLLASVLLSWLTFTGVENHLRFGGRNRLKVSLLSAGLIALAVVGLVTRKLDGIPSRAIIGLNIDEPSRQAPQIDSSGFGCGIADPNLARQFERCEHDTRDVPRIALMGDSKSRSLSVGLFRRSDAQSRLLFVGGHNDDVEPLPLLSDEPMYASFQPWTKVAIDAIANSADIRVVILTAAARSLFMLDDDASLEALPRSPHQRAVIEGLDKVVKAFGAHGKKVILTIDTPTLPAPEDCIMRRSPSALLNQLFPPRTRTCTISYDTQLRLSKNYRDAVAEVQRRNPAIFAVFDTLPILCDVAARTCSSINDGQLYYAYTDHISAFAAEKVAERLVPFAKEFGGLEARRD